MKECVGITCLVDNHIVELWRAGIQWNILDTDDCIFSRMTVAAWYLFTLTYLHTYNYVRMSLTPELIWMCSYLFKYSNQS